MERIEITPEKAVTDDELEDLARIIIEGMDKDDAQALCLALLDLYHHLVKPVYH